MYLIVRTSDLPSLARRRARVLPPPPLGAFPAPPHLATDRPDRMADVDELVGCCGCVAPGEIGQATARASEPIGAAVPPFSPDPLDAAAPPPFSPEPESARFAVGIDDAERRHLERRVHALEQHVSTLESTLARRDAAERAELNRAEALEHAEDRVFAALVELLSSVWERGRLERRRARGR